MMLLILLETNVKLTISFSVISGLKTTYETSQNYGLIGKTAINMEDDLTCSICLDIFNEPVMLDCSHNICRE
jgi:hypothetical protein